MSVQLNSKIKEELSIRQIYSPECSSSEENFYDSNGLYRVRIKESKDLLQCPTKGCDGLGHISGNYATHRSLSGCPHADRAMVAALHQDLKCPTEGCDGSGHITGNFTSHRSLSGCPRANRKRILLNNLNGNKKETGSESVHSNQSEHDSFTKSECNDNQIGFGKSNKIEYYSNNSALVSADSNDSLDSRKNRTTKLVSQVTCPTPNCDGRGHATGNFQRHRSVSGCPRVNSTNNIDNKFVNNLKNLKEYSDDESIDNEDIFIKSREEKDYDEIKERLNEDELELIRLENELKEFNNNLTLINDETAKLYKNNYELKRYYESLQIDFISIVSEIEIPEIASEKLNINNFNNYIDKLNFWIFEQDNLNNEQKKIILNLLKNVLQDFKIPKCKVEIA